MAELVVTEDRERVRHVVLNRPEKRNAMSSELLTELADALRAAGDDPSVHCVVLRGEGPVFSAGVDLAELGGMAQSDEGQALLRRFRTIFLTAANRGVFVCTPIDEMLMICPVLRSRIVGRSARISFTAPK